MRTTTDHATHDLERLSAAVDGTLPAADRPSLDAQLASCAACAELHADLLALVAANRALPTPGRPRDFQLTDADASRLQRGGLRGWFERIGSPKDRLSRPLAVGLTTLGLVGVLVGTAPSVLPSLGSSAGAAPAPASAAASAPGQELVGKGTDGQASAVPERGCRPGRGGAGAERRGVGRCCRRRDRTAGRVPGAAGGAVRTDPGDGSGSSRDLDAASNGIDQGVTQPELAAPSPGASSFETLSSSPSTDGGPSLILVLSVAALLAGIALFVLRSGARRRHS